MPVVPVWLRMELIVLIVVIVESVTVCVFSGLVVVP